MAEIITVIVTIRKQVTDLEAANNLIQNFQERFSDISNVKVTGQVNVRFEDN